MSNLVKNIKLEVLDIIDQTSEITTLEDIVNYYFLTKEEIEEIKYFLKALLVEELSTLSIEAIANENKISKFKAAKIFEKNNFKEEFQNLPLESLERVYKERA